MRCSLPASWMFAATHLRFHPVRYIPRIGMAVAFPPGQIGVGRAVLLLKPTSTQLTQTS